MPTVVWLAQDQTARASEARLLESELAREREESISLKRQLADAQSIEKERKKLSDKCDKLETKVGPFALSRLSKVLLSAKNQKMEEMIADKVAQTEAELNATYDERLRNYEDRYASS